MCYNDCIKKITKSREHLDFDVTGQFSGKVVYNGKPFKNVTVEISDRDSVVGTDDVHKEYKTEVPNHLRYVFLTKSILFPIQTHKHILLKTMH